MTIQLKGIIPPIVSPLDKNENVDKKAIERVVNYLIKGGVHGLFPLGSTGESYGLDFNQKREIIETVMEATNKRVPVYAGTGATTTKETISLTRLATEIGVDAVSVITPAFITPNDQELYNHYQAIASSTNLPIIMLTFGIPGDGVSAVVLGVLLINGLRPGPQLIGNQLHLIAPMFASLLISALIFIPLTLYILGPYLIKIVSIRKSILYSSIAAISMTGAYVSTNSISQMILTIILGGVIYLLRKQEFPSVPFLLGVLLGPLLEQYFRASMQINKGNPMIFLTHLDSVFFLVLTGVFYYFLIIRKRAY